jgi:hypothetical protein
MKVYYPKNLCNQKNRSHLFPLLKPFIKNNSFSDEQRVNMYHISDATISFENKLSDAEIIILPMSWNYYLENKQKQKAVNFVKLAIEQNKKVWSFTNGDFGVEIPIIKNVLIFRASGEKSKLTSNHIGLPSLIEDPLKKQFDKTEIFVNEYKSKPSIGFCGQSNGSIINAGMEISRTILRNLKYYWNLSNEVPQKVQSTSSIRAKALNLIKKSILLESTIIERKKYRAGAKTVDEKTATTKDFYNNIKNTDYTICIRGAGNFSVRLYETLAMGRIPILINTDCLLPLNDVIDWKKNVVWVEKNEINNLEEKVLKFHNVMTPREFENLQQANRTLWEESLTLGGFFKTFIKVKQQQ